MNVDLQRKAYDSCSFWLTTCYGFRSLDHAIADGLGLVALHSNKKNQGEDNARLYIQ